MRQFSLILLFPSILSFAQPLVHQEPHHIPIIESRFARVLNVSAKPGDTTLFHVHQNDIAYFTVKGANLFLEELNEEPRRTELPTGWAGSNLTHTETPLVHRFANLGPTDFQLIAVEVLTEKFSQKKFSQFGEVLHENERFSIQNIEDQILVSEVPMVLIEISKAGELTALELIKPRREFELVRGNDSAQLIIVQLK